MRIAKKHYVYAFSKDNQPIFMAKAPCHLTIETEDALNGQITSENQRMDNIDFNRVNPATGPVYIEDAEPGDILLVHIKAIRTAEKGVLMTAPGAGALPDVVKGKVLICPIAGDNFIFKDVKLALNPMIGVIGVAPAGEAVSCGIPGDHGGNMDTASIAEGSLLYLPIQVKGALFAAGDLHAAMGDGEVCVTGLEIAGEIDLVLDVVKNMHLPCPMLKSEEELSFLASAETVDEALERSTRYMHELLLRYTTLDEDEALMLMSVCGQARISQIVDPLKTARFCMPLSVLKKFGVSLAF